MREEQSLCRLMYFYVLNIHGGKVAEEGARNGPPGQGSNPPVIAKCLSIHIFVQFPPVIRKEAEVSVWEIRVEWSSVCREENIEGGTVVVPPLGRNGCCTYLYLTTWWKSAGERGEEWSLCTLDMVDLPRWLQKIFPCMLSFDFLPVIWKEAGKFFSGSADEGGMFVCVPRGKKNGGMMYLKYMEEMWWRMK